MINLDGVAFKIKSFLKQNWLILFLFFLLFTRVDDYPMAPLAKNAMARAPMAVVPASARLDRVETISDIKTDRKISKSLRMDIEVKNIKSAKENLEKYVKEVGGIVDNFSSYEYYNKTAYNFYMKIPADKLDDFANYVKKQGILKNENFSSKDKTDSYVDNGNRLKNLEVRRDSLRKLMETKARQVSDIISIEKELNSAQIEIERFEKNNQKIQDSVDYSDVNLTLTPRVVLDSNGSSWNFNKSINNGINVSLRFCQKFVDYLIILLLFTPLILFLFLMYRTAVFFRKK